MASNTNAFDFFYLDDLGILDADLHRAVLHAAQRAGNLGEHMRG